MSIIATAVKHLLAAGVTGDALVEAIADMESNLAAYNNDPVAERRRAYDRERKRANKTCRSGGIPVESSDSTETVENPPLPLPSPQTPLPTPAPVKKNNAHTRTRGARITEDWNPEPLAGDAGRIAAMRGQEWLGLEMTKFRNHWLSATGSAAMKLDWQRTWENWVIRANELGRPPPGAFRQQSSPSPQSDLHALMRQAERYRTSTAA